MSAPILRDLAVQASPGPWFLSHGYVREQTSGNPIVSIVMRGYDDPMAKANAQLIARCSPDVMLRVYEALIGAQIDFKIAAAEHPNRIERESAQRNYHRVSEALRLLDGAAQQDKEDKP